MEGKDIMVSDTQISEMLKKIWKTVTIGIGPKTGYEFCQVLYDNSFTISPRAESMLQSSDFRVVDREMSVNLIRVKVIDLGFERDAQREEVLALVGEYGLFSLYISLLEVAPSLCLQYLEQPKEEQLLFDMEPIPDLNGDLSMFGIRRIGPKRQFYADYGDSKIIYSPETELIFVYFR